MKRRLFKFPWRTARDIRSDVDDELRFHIDERTAALTAAGLTPDAARTQALREFGDVDDARREISDYDRGTESRARRKDYLGELRQDLAYAVRKLRSAPTFTLTAIATLALGIGANVAIFSVVDGVLLRPLPFPHAEQLLQLWAANPGAGIMQASTSPLDVDDWRAQKTQMSELGGYWFANGFSGAALTGRGDPQRISVTFVTPGFFPTLGVNPLIGRVPREDELVRGGRDRNVVLSYGFWQREFGSSRAILDSTVILNDEPYQVLGVMPRDFRFPSEQVDAYVPYSTIPNSSIPRIRQVHILHVIGRLKAGATPAMASVDLNVIAKRLAQEHPEVAAWTGASVQPLRESITGDVKPALLVLLGAVTFVLLMACVN
ncbi:MAG: ABC transporter permease, partial [Gemmatimonadaceae bacterium]